MNSYEYFLINKYHPILNISYNIENFNINITEPEWILYIEEDKRKTKKTLSSTEIHYKEARLGDLSIFNADLKTETEFYDSPFTNLKVFDQKILLFMILNNKIKNQRFSPQIFPVKDFSIYFSLTHQGMYDYCLSSSFLQRTSDKQYIFSFPDEEKIKNSVIFNLDIKEINKFSQVTCKYTIPIFEIIYLLKGKQIDRFDLMKSLSPNTQAYMNFKESRARIIEPALRNLKTIGYDFTYETIFSGRKITHVVFKNNEEVDNL